MQINNIDNQTSFTSRGSIKKMLKFPGNSTVVKDINKVTGSFVDYIHFNKKSIGNFELRQPNRTSFNKSKEELKDFLSVDSETDALIKDENIAIPFKDFLKLIDIVSKNLKKPISKLMPKLDKNPSLSNLMDNIKALKIVKADPEITFMSVFNLLSGTPVKQKAIIISGRDLIANTNESVSMLLNPFKKDLSNSLKEDIDEKDYKIFKKFLLDSLESLKELLKGKPNSKSSEQLSEIFIKLKNVHMEMVSLSNLEKNIQVQGKICKDYEQAIRLGKQGLNGFLDSDLETLEFLKKLKEQKLQNLQKILEG